MDVRVDEHQAGIESSQAQLLRELFARQRAAFDQSAEHIIQRNQRVVIVLSRHPLPYKRIGTSGATVQVVF